MSGKSFFLITITSFKKSIPVLHTGKRWFIICPVEEIPTSSQETPSDGTTTQSPGSSATMHLADSTTAKPSRGDCKFSNNIQQLQGARTPPCGSTMTGILQLRWAKTDFTINKVDLFKKKKKKSV